MSGLWRTVRGEAGPLRAYCTSEQPGAGPVIGGGGGPVLVLCHDLPRVEGSGADVARTFPALADRLALESGWRVVTPTFRGAGGSVGDFSAGAWLRDLVAVLADEVGPQDPAWLVGFGLGGALALRLAVDDGRVQGLVCLGTAADLSGWAGLGASLVARCRATGVITDPAFPPDVAAWSAELAALRPVEAAAQLGARPLLVVHGVDDVDVPTADARALADAASGPVELRLVHGAGHWLRADPRVVAMLIGWIERRH